MREERGKREMKKEEWDTKKERDKEERIYWERRKRDRRGKKIKETEGDKRRKDDAEEERLR